MTICSFFPFRLHREVDGKGSREERAAAEVAMASSTNLESLSYALFVVNGLYLVRGPRRAFSSKRLRWMAQ